ncbi:uncharacterized protein [Arachis hypogaea]|uniref:uncharacterized protein n=1 Tax=Arachis hypogaea TaxID=3818 RepID=UPI003B21FBF0
MLLILENNDKLIDPEHYNSLARTEIPSKEVEPHLHYAVLKHMIHDPCETLDQSLPCMKNGQCKRNYEKKFAAETRRGDDSYPQYRRRIDTPVPINQNVIVDNRWVVPYNPWLLLKYDCHINVEICSSIKSIKYLYKYCYKVQTGLQWKFTTVLMLTRSNNLLMQDGSLLQRHVGEYLNLTFYRMYPSVEMLQIHLPNQHRVSFYDHQIIPEILNDDYFSRTMLTEFFALNCEEDQQSRHLLYRKIPEGPISWDDLLTVNGVQYSSFKQSSQHRGLLESDSSIRACLVETSVLRFPCALRRLFAIILIFCEPTDVRSLWDEFFSYMVDDYPSASTTTALVFTNRLLRDINDILLQHKKQITQYNLPALTHENDNDNSIPRVIQEKLFVEVPREDMCSVVRLNNDQSKAFKCIMNTIDRRESGVFFVDGSGGSGKIFLYRAIITELRNKGHIVLVTASSGIAATLLPRGRIAHSRFKIPINAEPSSICNISKQSDLAKLIRQTMAIIWDEAPMANKESVRPHSERYISKRYAIWRKSDGDGRRFPPSTACGTER